MNLPRKMVFLTCLSAFLYLAERPALATQSDKSAVMTVSEPIIVGQTVLAPGTYLWKLVDSPSDRNIIEITDHKTGHIETTVLGIPKYRQDVSAANQLQFWETPLGVPRAVKSWFFPGDSYGQEFPYPEKLVAALRALLPPNPSSSSQPMTMALKVEPLKKVIAKHAAMAPYSAHLPEHPALPTGSWAVSSYPGPSAPHLSASAKRPSGLWDRVKNLPLTATLAPLIGLIGAVALILFFLTKKRRNGLPAAPRQAEGL